MSIALRYAKVACRIRGDKKYRALTLHGAYAFDGLLHSEHQNGLPGFWRASEAVILSDDVPHLSPEEWRRARAELEAAGMIRISDDERLVWLVNAVRAEYNAPDNPNVARSWARKLAQFEASPLFVEYFTALLVQSEHWGRGIRDTFYGALEECGLAGDHAPRRLPAPAQTELTLLPPAEPDPSKPSKSTPVREVFAHWCAVMQHPSAVLDKKRERVIRAALELRPIEDCKRAIDGCRASAWHMGENDRGKVYDSLTLIFRDAEHIERFLDCLDNPTAGPAGDDSGFYHD